MTEAEQTRAKRSGVIIRAAIETGATSVERRVRNLSQHGACVDNAGDLVAGTIVRVSMGSVVRLAAEVVWAKPALAGLRFRFPVDLEQARKARNAPTTARAGWIHEVDDPYRRRA